MFFLFGFFFFTKKIMRIIQFCRLLALLGIFYTNKQSLHDNDVQVVCYVSIIITNLTNPGLSNMQIISTFKPAMLNILQHNISSLAILFPLDKCLEAKFLCRKETFVKLLTGIIIYSPENLYKFTSMNSILNSCLVARPATRCLRQGYSHQGPSVVCLNS